MKLTVYLLLFFSTLNFAQNSEEYKLSGNLRLDNVIAETAVPFKADVQQTEFNQMKKSPLLAGVMSFVIPGSGEFYAGSYWKSAIFIAVEAAAITAAIIYDQKGNDQTIVFQDFANANWDVARYAQFTIDNLNRLNSNVYNDADKLNYYQNNLFYDDQKTKVNWGVLNQLENDIGSYYSHRLAPYGDQQYYEMIGKYPQFNPGWSDFNNPDYTYGDPLTENFLFYSSERGKANDFYNVASKAVVVVVVNHILSAADAAWTAHSYNNDLKVRLGLEKQQIGFYYDLYPKLNIQVRL